MRLWTVRYLRRSPLRGLYERTEEIAGYSRDDVRAALERRGVTAVSIRPTRPRLWAGLAPGDGDAALRLLQSLAFHARGLPPPQALATAIALERNPRHRVALMPARAVLDGGGEFGVALQATGLFDHATLALLKAGEQTGSLAATLHHAVEQLRARSRTLRRLLAVFAWLVMDLSMVLSFVVAVDWYLPQLEAQGIQTRSAEARAAFEASITRARLVNNALTVLAITAVAAGIVLGMFYWRNRHDPEHPAVRLVQALPGVRRYAEDLAMAVAWQVLARLASAGRHAGLALPIVAESCWHRGARRYWMRAARLLESSSPGEALAIDPLPEDEKGRLATHRTTADLALVAADIAEMREHRVERHQRRLVQGLLYATITYILLAVLNVGQVILLLNQAGGEYIQYFRDSF